MAIFRRGNGQGFGRATGRRVRQPFAVRIVCRQAQPWRQFRRATGATVPRPICRQSRRQVRADLPTIPRATGSGSLPTVTRQTHRNRPPWRSRFADGFAPAPIRRRALCRSCAPWQRSRVRAGDGSPPCRRRSRRGDLPTGNRRNRPAPICQQSPPTGSDGRQFRRGNRADSSDGQRFGAFRSSDGVTGRQVRNGHGFAVAICRR